jgi:hypothetical protein
MFLLASLKTLTGTNFKILPVTLFTELIVPYLKLPAENRPNIEIVRQPKSLKTTGACSESMYLCNFIDLKKITQSLKHRESNLTD